MIKQPTPEQARQFHLALTGKPYCFPNCCLCNATTRNVALEAENAALERVAKTARETEQWAAKVLDGWNETNWTDKFEALIVLGVLKDDIKAHKTSLSVALSALDGEKSTTPR